MIASTYFGESPSIVKISPLKYTVGTCANEAKEKPAKAKLSSLRSFWKRDLETVFICYL
jgi:hypothetical protein